MDQAILNGAKNRRRPSKTIYRPKIPHLLPMGAIYREEEVVVYTYSIGGVEYYKKILDIYK